MEHVVARPVRTIELTGRVQLLAHQLNEDLYLNVKAALRRRVEGFCNQHGYVVRVHRIEELSDGVLQAENFSGSVMFDVRYVASVCAPAANDVVIARVSKDSNPSFVLLEHGPIAAVVHRDRAQVQEQRFDVDGIGRIRLKDGTELVPGMYVKVGLRMVRVNNGDRKILAWGYLEDVATEDEVKADAYEAQVGLPLLGDEDAPGDALFNEEDEVDVEPIAPEAPPAGVDLNAESE